MLHHLRNNSKVNKYINQLSVSLIYLLLITIPFTHKEAFSVFDNDLVISKFVLSLISVFGVYYVVTNWKKYVFDPFFALLSLLIFFQALSLIPSLDRINTTKIVAFQLAVLFTYPVIRNYVTQVKGDLAKLYWFYFAGVMVTLLFLTLQVFSFVTYGYEMGGVWPSFGVPTRYGSTFWDVNHYGAYLSAFILLSIGFVIQTLKKGMSKSGKINVFYIIVICFSLVALYLTRSRSSMISFAAGLLIFASLYFDILTRGRKFITQLYVYLAAVLVPILSFGFLFLFSEQIRTALFYRAYSTFAHLFLIKTGLNMWLDEPVFGIGANAFHAQLLNSKWKETFYFIDPADVSLKLPIHSIWLESLTETGIFAFLVFVFFWLLLLVTLFRRFRSKNDYIALGLFAGITSYLVGGLIYSYKAEFFWIFVLISAAYSYNFEFSSIIKDTKLNESGIINYFSKLKSYLIPKTFSLSKFIIFTLSFTILITPLVYLTMPLNQFEIQTFYSDFQVSYVTNMYVYLLNLFRYIFGNYSYSGRILSIIFYISSVILLWNIFRRYLSSFLAFILTSVFLGIINTFSLLTVVSIRSYMLFVILLLVGSAMLILNKFRKIKIGEYRDSFSIKILSLLVVVFAGLFISINIQVNSSNNPIADLAFLSELAYNKRIMDDSDIWIGSEMDSNVVYYYCDEIDLINRKFELTECRVNDLAFYSGYVNFNKKNLILSSSEYYKEKLPNFIQERGGENLNLSIIYSGNDYFITHTQKPVKNAE